MDAQTCRAVDEFCKGGTVKNEQRLPFERLPLPQVQPEETTIPSEATLPHR